MSRYNRSDPEFYEYEKPTFCSQFLHYTWKTISCLFSHITLVAMVVSYCVLGAYAFATLEVGNEIKVKKGIPLLRKNVTDHLWNLTHNDELPTFEETNFTKRAKEYLKNFEVAILQAMTKDGWDGEEDQNKSE
ncbi:hypothetical protein NQ317_017810 [Molorchus minor]|uniref:Uncharacterized protein n=1 Tax=Molorchus minor TaxID=1323400 RepID=A0ABQ9K3J5_9CUCU|nr:hypothetical protein NQ317_017810 [Molorchus minor]